MLMAAPMRKVIEGQSFVNPSDLSRATAHTVSKRPEISRISQCIGLSFSPSLRGPGTAASSGSSAGA